MTTEARVADYEREDMLYREQARLVAELNDARAHIAFLRDALGEDRKSVWRDAKLSASTAEAVEAVNEWQAELNEARAQIAAKDAALREARETIVAWADCDNAYVQSDLAQIDAALAAPAREDAMIEAAEVSAENRQETT